MKILLSLSGWLAGLYLAAGVALAEPATPARPKVKKSAKNKVAEPLEKESATVLVDEAAFEARDALADWASEEELASSVLPPAEPVAPQIDPCAAPDRRIVARDKPARRAIRDLEQRLLRRDETLEQERHVPLGFVPENGQWPGLLLDGPQPKGLADQGPGSVLYTRYQSSGYPVWQVTGLGECRMLHALLVLPIEGLEGRSHGERRSIGEEIAHQTRFTVWHEVPGLERAGKGVRPRNLVMSDIPADGKLVTAVNISVALNPGLNRIHISSVPSYSRQPELSRHRTIEIWYQGD